MHNIYIQKFTSSHFASCHVLHRYTQINERNPCVTAAADVQPCSVCRMRAEGIPRDWEMTYIPGLIHPGSPGHLSIIPAHHNPDEG